MRTLVLPLLLHLSLLTAGIGVLRLAGSRPRSTGDGFAQVGLAYLVGLAAVFAVLELLLVSGVPFNLVTIFLVAGALSLPAALVVPAALRVGARLRPRHVVRFPVLAGAVIAAAWLCAFIALCSWPLKEWDAWAMWTYKAQIMSHLDHLPVATFQSNDVLPYTHYDYPLTLSLWEAAHFRALGVADTSHAIALQWMLLPAWIGGALTLAPRRTPRLVVATVAVGVGLLLVPQLVFGYADVLVAMFLGLGVLAAGRWLVDRGRSDLILAVVLLGGASGVKNEGIIGGAVLFAALALSVVRDRPQLTRAIAAGAAWGVAFVLPWKLWLRAHDIHGDLPIGKAVDPGFLVDHADRFKVVGLWVSNTAALGGITTIAPLAILVMLLTRGSARTARARSMRRFVIVGFALYGIGTSLAWIVTPWDLTWHIFNSAQRVMSVLAVIGAAGILLLTAPEAADADADEPPTADEAAAADESAPHDAALDQPRERVPA